MKCNLNMNKNGTESDLLFNDNDSVTFSGSNEDIANGITINHPKVPPANDDAVPYHSNLPEQLYDVEYCDNGGKSQRIKSSPNIISKNYPVKTSEELDKEMYENLLSIGRQNYHQITVPRKVCFSTDEIYKRAYGGSNDELSPMDLFNRDKIPLVEKEKEINIQGFNDYIEEKPLETNRAIVGSSVNMSCFRDSCKNFDSVNVPPSKSHKFYNNGDFIPSGNDFIPSVYNDLQNDEAEVDHTQGFRSGQNSNEAKSKIIVREFSNLCRSDVCKQNSENDNVNDCHSTIANVDADSNIKENRITPKARLRNHQMKPKSQNRSLLGIQPQPPMQCRPRKIFQRHGRIKTVKVTEEDRLDAVEKHCDQKRLVYSECGPSHVYTQDKLDKYFSSIEGFYETAKLSDNHINRKQNPNGNSETDWLRITSDCQATKSDHVVIHRLDDVSEKLQEINLNLPKLDKNSSNYNGVNSVFACPQCVASVDPACEHGCGHCGWGLREGGDAVSCNLWWCDAENGDVIGVKKDAIGDIIDDSSTDENEIKIRDDDEVNCENCLKSVDRKLILDESRPSRENRVRCPELSGRWLNDLDMKITDGCFSTEPRDDVGLDLVGSAGKCEDREGEEKLEDGDSGRVHLGDRSGVHLGDSSRVHLGDSSGVHLGDSSGVLLGDSSGVLLGDSSGVHLGDIRGVHLGSKSEINLDDMNNVTQQNQVHMYDIETESVPNERVMVTDGDEHIGSPNEIDKDSGRPSSGEAREVTAEEPYRSNDEIFGICSQIEDPVIKSYVKNYLKGKQLNMDCNNLLKRLEAFKENEKDFDMVMEVKKRDRDALRRKYKENGRTTLTENSKYNEKGITTLTENSKVVESSSKLADTSGKENTDHGQQMTPDSGDTDLSLDLRDEPSRSEHIEKHRDISGKIDIEIFSMAEGQKCRKVRGQYTSGIVPRLDLTRSSSDDSIDEGGHFMGCRGDMGVKNRAKSTSVDIVKNVGLVKLKRPSSAPKYSSYMAANRGDVKRRGVTSIREYSRVVPDVVVPNEGGDCQPKTQDSRTKQDTEFNVVQAWLKYQEMTPRIQEGTYSMWLCLPDELLLRIFSHLSLPDLACCAMTCKHFHRVSKDHSLWRVIKLSKKPLNDTWLSLIGQHKPNSLSFTGCHGNAVTDVGLRSLFRQTAASLTSMTISGCSKGRLTGDAVLLQASVRCHHIRHLDVSWTGVTNHSVTAMCETCTSLESLSIGGCQTMTDDDLDAVLKKHGSSLRALDLVCNLQLTQKSAHHIGQRCPNLRRVNLGQCFKITDASVAHMCATLPLLEYLDIRGCNRVKNCIKKTVKCCRQLRSVVVANCPLISDSTLISLLELSQTLRYLDVCGCINVTDESMHRIVSTCTHLVALDISSTGCSNRSVLSLARHHPKDLEVVKMSFLPNLKIEAVIKLVASCDSLRTLHLYGCRNIRSISEISAINPKVSIEK